MARPHESDSQAATIDDSLSAWERRKLDLGKELTAGR